MALASRFYALLFAFYILLLVVKPASGGSKTGYHPNLLRKRNNIDETSDKKEVNSIHSSQEVDELAGGEGSISSGLSSEDDFDSSGVLDVELASGSADGNSTDRTLQKENTEIKLNGKRLHSISEAITKLLNSGRKRLDSLRQGKYSDIKKASGPVLHAYVSDNHYDDYEDQIPTKLYRKNILHHRRHHRPYYSRRRNLPSDLDFTGMPYEPFSELPALGYEDDVAKVPEYKKPMYPYYPDMLPQRYDTIPQQYPSELSQNVEPEEVERAILSNYALRQELAGLQFYSCHPNPCKHRGRCRRVRFSYKCICKGGFSGKHCHIRRRDRCRHNPCVNGGSCTEVSNGYECTCQMGYKGQNCQEETRCKYNSCHNGGTCTELNESFQCMCAPGFQGSTCKEHSSCYSSPCKNDGTCLESKDSFTCLCESQWTCRDCTCPAYPKVSPYLEGEQEKRGDSCHPNPCRNSGSCVSRENGFKCYCPDGYTGNTCETHDFCSSDPCLNDGTCHQTPTGYHCLCQPEFRGKTCEKENHCKPINPCENNGLCIETEDGYKCHCKIGFHGFNCEERQFCKPNPCKSGGICLPDADTYMCTCPIGYKGKNCGIRDLCSSGPCFNKGTCVDTEDNNYKCLCSQEWIGNQCEAKNPCYPNPCSNDGHCDIVDGHYECHCVIGFKGDKCKVRDLCRPSPCHNEGTCIQRGPDDFDCECKRGFIGDNCQGIDACSSNPCLSGGTCMEAENGFKCMCEVEQIGLTCEAVNPCYPDPCHNSAVCMAHPEGDHHCQCSEGFVGQLCEAVDPCEPSPCENNSTCVNVGKSYKCKCTEGYAGNHCEIKSKCLPNPCHNDATCRDIATGRGYVCFCSIAYIGPTCEKPNLCHPSNPCKNGGTCKTDGTNIGCKCKPEYLGSHCEQLNFCFGNPCTNGGTCTPKLDGFECDCPEGHYGKTCDALSSPCMPSPCKNEGLCSEVKNKDGYICICKQGFIGRTCDRRDNCSPNPCLYNGTCLQAQTHRGYHCLCHKGWHGYHCGRIDRCYPSPCMNGGACFNSENEFTCQCPDQYMGKRCGVDKCLRCGLDARCIKGTCECNAGYVGNGFTCTASGNPCLPNPCENNGLCTPGHGGKVFKCACHPGFQGEKCEITLSACKSRPCLNSGVCVDTTNNNGTLLEGIVLASTTEFKCVCSKGYAGAACDKLVLKNPCITHPCTNGGTCYDDTNSQGMDLKLVNALDYRCFCPMSYSGKKCQVPQPACQSTPCMNGGTCIDPSNTADVAFNANGYKCLCLTIYSGINCEIGSIKLQLNISKAEEETNLLKNKKYVELTQPGIQTYITPGEEQRATENEGATYQLSTKDNAKGNALEVPPPSFPKPGKPVITVPIPSPTASPAVFALLNEESNKLPDMATTPVENVLTESYAPSPVAPSPVAPSPVASPIIVVPPDTTPSDIGVTREKVAEAKVQNHAPKAYTYRTPASTSAYGTVNPYSYPAIQSFNGQRTATHSGQQNSNPAGRGISSTGSLSSSLNRNAARLSDTGNRYQYNTPNGSPSALATNYGAYYQQGINQRNHYQNPVSYSNSWGGSPYAAYIENKDKDDNDGLRVRHDRRQDKEQEREKREKHHARHHSLKKHQKNPH